MLIHISIVYAILIFGYILLSVGKAYPNIKIIGYLLLIASAIFCLPLMHNMDKVSNYLNSGNSGIFGILFGLIGFYYIIGAIYYIIKILRSFIKFRGLWIISSIIYVLLFRMLFFTVTTSNDSFTVSNISIINYIFIIVIAFRIIIPLLLNFKHKIEVNNIEKYEIRKREEFKKGYGKFFDESCPKFNLKFTREEYNDLWLGNSEAIKYLAMSRDNLNKLGDELRKAIQDKDIFEENIPAYFYSAVEPLFERIKQDLETVNKDFNILNLGISGEDKVDKILNTHKYIKNLSNLVIKDVDGQRVECDNLLVTEKGIFIIEVKNYGSNGRFTLKIDNSGRWERVYNSNSYVMDSPFGQNSRHIGIIKNILLEHSINIPVYGIIVIANDTVDIINNSNNMVVRADFLVDTINNFRGEIFIDIKQRDDIANLFKNMREAEVKHTFRNYNMYNNNFNVLLDIIKTNNNYREFVYNLYYRVYGKSNNSKC